MALEIIESCVNCWACAPLCPNKAIYEAAPHFLIDADKCTEWWATTPMRSAAIRPIEGATSMNWRG
jgi:Fe-S-cluster-containing hydrogenase component 2